MSIKVNSRPLLKFKPHVFLPGLFVGAALADKIVLENGDTLTGTVEKVVEGKLTFKPSIPDRLRSRSGRSNRSLPTIPSRSISRAVRS